jgi:hypothetical protein
MANTVNMASNLIDEEKAVVACIEGNSTSKDQDHEYQANHEHTSIGHYLASRFTTLKPTFTIPLNPIKSLALLSRKDWLFFSVSAPYKYVILSCLNPRDL